MVVILAAASAFVCVAKNRAKSTKKNSTSTKKGQMSNEGPSADLTIEQNIPAQTQIPTNVGQKLLRAHISEPMWQRHPEPADFVDCWVVAGGQTYQRTQGSPEEC